MILLTLVILLHIITEGFTLQEGEDCVLTNNGQKGKCINVYECDEVREILQSNQRPQHCGFNRQTELVCCSIRNEALQTLPGAVSDKMCREYHKVKKIPPVAIAQGVWAKPRELAHIAALGYFDGKTTQWLCGGTIISEKFILTASHCSTHRDFGPPKVVRVGDLDLSSNNDDANPQDVAIQQFYTHPSYKSPSVYHDIALIKLQKPMDFDPYIRPACLHPTRSIPTNFLQVAGWGKTDFYGETSSHLMKANLTIVNRQMCSQRFPPHQTRMKNGIIDEMHICAGDTSGRDTCPGDSGGPLYFQRSCSDCGFRPHFVVAGVTAFGKGCGAENSIGVYTRVSLYISWIEKIVWE